MIFLFNIPKSNIKYINGKTKTVHKKADEERDLSNAPDNHGIIQGLWFLCCHRIPYKVPESRRLSSSMKVSALLRIEGLARARRAFSWKIPSVSGMDESGDVGRLAANDVIGLSRRIAASGRAPER